MSFFKKLVDKVEDMFDDDKDKAKQGENQTQAPPHDQNQTRNYGGEQQQYQQQPQYQQYPPQQQQYPPPSGPPAPYGAPPPMPPGWHAQWDQNQNRWYYVEQSTGRSQWDPPVVIGNHPPQGPYGPPAGAPPGEAPYALNRGQSDSYYNGQSPMPPPPQQGEFGHNNHNGYSGGQGDSNYGGAEKKESSGTGKLVAAGIGGAALGALGGAVIAHEMTEDDNENKAAAQPIYAAPADGSSYQPVGAAYVEPQHPAYAEELPEETRSGSSVSSSDRESLEERREELEEMQREYEEAYEETYED